LQNIEVLKSKEQLQIAYAVLSGKSRASSALCVYFSPSLAVIFPLSALFASMLALLNLPFAISIETSSALSLSPFFRFSIALRMFRLNEMSKLEFVNKMNDIQNKNATKLILNQNRVNQAVMNFDKGNIGGFSFGSIQL
jgi:hypothetical protein